jgi:signal recognition particle subunit SEC65
MTLWKVNLTADVSRAEGRKIARGLAVKDVTVEEISQAAEKLDLTPVVDHKTHPHGIEGRVIVDKKYPKIKALKLIADEIRRIRKEEK